MVKTYSYNNNKDMYLSKHFQVKEFRSYNALTNTLTTDAILIDDNLIIMLEKLYDYLDNKYQIKSIIITSGYRNLEFEMSLAGGVYNSKHMQGKAVDIVVNKKNGGVVDPKLVCIAAQTIGFNGIGYGGNYTHVDVRDSKSYFDETNNKTNINSFYEYFNISNNSYKHKVGDKVTINAIFVSSDSTDRLTPKINTGIITSIKENSRNPYLLNGGNIGWANDEVIITNNYLSNTNYKGTSIVDALNQIKVDSSYSYRKKLASVNNISNYTGSTQQNTKLLSLLKEGKLVKA